MYGNSYCLAILSCTIEQKNGVGGIKKFFGALFDKSDGWHLCQLPALYFHIEPTEMETQLLY